MMRSRDEEMMGRVLKQVDVVLTGPSEVDRAHLSQGRGDQPPSSWMETWYGSCASRFVVDR